MRGGLFKRISWVVALIKVFPEGSGAVGDLTWACLLRVPFAAS